nr:MAG: putative triple gene block protein 1 [Sichuan alphaflexivirus 1]
MLKLKNLLESFGFRRTDRPLSHPLVIHAIAGAGKTTLINKFLAEGRNIEVVTPGKAPDSTLTYCENTSTEELALKVLDEYQAYPHREAFDVLIGDPLQGGDLPVFEPHYLKEESHRFGVETCKLLKAAGIHAISSKPDTVIVRHYIGAEPEGQLIAVDTEGKKYLESFGLNPKFPLEVLGETFPIVTVLLTRRIKEYPRHLVYIAFSRHSSRLIVLSPNAPD